MYRPYSKLKHRLESLLSFSFLISRPIEDPIRSELFSSERFDQHARSLAVAQTITDNPKSGVPLTPRLRENERILQESFRYLTREVQKNKPINPAGEWLMDSFYVVEEQLRDIKRFLPHDFYNELPKLSEGFLKGYPRVYGLAWAYVAHTDSRFDAESLTNFVRSYQRVQPLTIGELWALAITLRVVMVDNLRRIAIYLVTSQEARQDADAFVDELLGLIEESSKATRPSAAQLKRQSAHPAFLVQLIQRLRYQDPTQTPAVQWLNERIADKKTTAEEMVTAVHSRQAANNSTVRNIITSFRAMTTFDWQEFFEQVSLVHEILSRHPQFPQLPLRGGGNSQGGQTERAGYRPPGVPESGRRFRQWNRTASGSGLLPFRRGPAGLRKGGRLQDPLQKPVPPPLHRPPFFHLHRRRGLHHLRYSHPGGAP
jgi:cyclic beta-1,2-glucan synthetase